MLSGSLFAFFSDPLGLNNERRDLLSLQREIDVMVTFSGGQVHFHQFFFFSRLKNFYFILLLCILY